MLRMASRSVKSGQAFKQPVKYNAQCTWLKYIFFPSPLSMNQSRSAKMMGHAFLAFRSQLYVVENT
jgi:hypothetical protein